MLRMLSVALTIRHLVMTDAGSQWSGLGCAVD